MADSTKRTSNTRSTKDEKRQRKTDERREQLRRQAQERAAASTGAPRQSAGGSGSSSAPRRSTRKPVKRRRRIPLKAKVRIGLILVLLIFAIVQISHIADYFSKRTDIRLTDEGITHSERFGTCVALNGIDVSEHQNSGIKWKQAKTSGVDFTFIRAGYRSADDGTLHTDEHFAENMKNASKAGIMVGAYFYSQALTPAEAEEEAEYLLELVEPYDITMPLVIDFEIYPDGRLDKKIKAGELYAASFYHDIVLAFCRKVEAEGYESAVYANKDMLTHYMQADLLDDEATIWLAQYGKTSDLDADYRFWQCSDSASAGGIAGNVDHDFWYLRPNKVYKTRGAGIREKKRVSIGDCHVSFQESTTKLKRLRAIPKLSVSYKNRALREGKDYQISYVRNTQEGTGFVIVRGIRKYKNLIMLPFTIEE